MLTPDALLELHRRTHHGNINLLENCRQLSDAELHREVFAEGMGSVQAWLHHMIGAEQYWLMVLRGRFEQSKDLTDVERREWDEAIYPTVDALEAYRADIAARGAAYLNEISADELAAPRLFHTIDPEPATLVPMYAITRVITHYFHHRGQVAAMCRLLGYPVPRARASLDFPIGPEASA